MFDDNDLKEFSRQIKAMVRERSRSICDYCGCTHDVRVKVDGPSYTLIADAGTCYRYMQDMHSEARAIKERMNIPIDLV